MCKGVFHYSDKLGLFLFHICIEPRVLSIKFPVIRLCSGSTGAFFLNDEITLPPGCDVTNKPTVQLRVGPTAR